MKPKYSCLQSTSTIRRFSAFAKAITLSFGVVLFGISQSVQATDVTHSLTDIGDGTWTGATWTNGTPDASTADDLALNNPLTGTSVITLNSDVTIGSLANTGSARGWTIDSNATNFFTLNGANVSSATNGFGHAGVASIRMGITGTNTFTINPNIVLASNVDIGAASGNDPININGNITASSAATLNFQQNSTGAAVTIAGTVGASGSNIAITNSGTGAGTVAITGALGSSVTSITQNSATSTLNLNGANPSFANPITISAGTLNIGSGGVMGATGNITGAGSLSVGGSLTLSGNNTYTGNTSISSGGTLIISGSNNLGATSVTTLAAGGTLQLRANSANTAGFTTPSTALGIAEGNFTFASGASTLQLRSDSATSYAGLQGLTIALGRTLNIDVDTVTPAATGGVLSFAPGGIVATDLTINVTGNSNGTGSTLAIGTLSGSSGGVRVTTINPTTANVAMAGYTVTGIAGSGVVLDGTSSGNTFVGIGGNANTAVTKNGSSTWTLTGVSTYTGNTLVNAGTLVLADNARLRFALGATSGTNNNITGAGTVSLNGDFAIDTSAAAALSSGTWVLENVTSLPGAYGGTFTVVDIDGTPWMDAGSNTWTKTDGTKTWSFLETTGTLTLTDSGGTDYDTWAAIYSPADLSDMGDDNDNDGLTNQQEYAYGLSPVSGSSVNPILVGLNKSAGTFTYQRRKQSLTGLTYTVLTSPNLVTWTPNTPSGEVVTPIASTDNESVAITLSGTIPLPATKFFVRVGAE